MRLATLRACDGGFPGVAGTHTVAAVHDGEQWRGLDMPDLSDLFAHDSWRRVAEKAQRGGPVVEGAYHTPLPTPTKVICCGLNYADHIRETGRDLPEYPTLFTKFADSLLADGDDIAIASSTAVDWEAELAVVVGSLLRDATTQQAAAGIAGYTAANDISMRDWQRRTLQWFQGKAWDASTPVGPVVVTADELDPAAGLDISCEVNGVRTQHDSTAQLVFGAADLLSYISRFTVLRPGDLVLTGTPGGVGMGMTPPRYLADGDIVTVRVEGIGALTNTFHTR